MVRRRACPQHWHVRFLGSFYIPWHVTEVVSKREGKKKRKEKLPHARSNGPTAQASWPSDAIIARGSGLYVPRAISYHHSDAYYPACESSPTGDRVILGAPQDVDSDKFSLCCPRTASAQGARRHGHGWLAGPDSCPLLPGREHAGCVNVDARNQGGRVRPPLLPLALFSCSSLPVKVSETALAVSHDARVRLICAATDVLTWFRGGTLDAPSASCHFSVVRLSTPTHSQDPLVRRAPQFQGQPRYRHTLHDTQMLCLISEALLPRLQRGRRRNSYNVTWTRLRILLLAPTQLLRKSSSAPPTKPPSCAAPHNLAPPQSPGSKHSPSQLDAPVRLSL